MTSTSRATAECVRSSARIGDCCGRLRVLPPACKFMLCGTPPWASSTRSRGLLHADRHDRPAARIGIAPGAASAIARFPAGETLPRLRRATARATGQRTGSAATSRAARRARGCPSQPLASPSRAREHRSLVCAGSIRTGRVRIDPRVRRGAVRRSAPAIGSTDREVDDPEPGCPPRRPPGGWPAHSIAPEYHRET
jgi:hypothetical protein